MVAERVLSLIGAARGEITLLFEGDLVAPKKLCLVRAMQSMACMYSSYIDTAERAITPMFSGIRIGDNGCYGYCPPVVANFQRELDMRTEADSFVGGVGPGYCGQPVLEGSSMDSSPSSQSSCGSTGKNRKTREDKICGVCGDKALGFNFDAISCESCKAFFRRNAPKGLDYFKCPYDERCKMDLSNRRFCKRCRLKKCFEIGMRKEYILTEEEKAHKRQKIEENRYLKKICVFKHQKPSNIESLDDMDSIELCPVQMPTTQIPSPVASASPPGPQPPPTPAHQSLPAPVTPSAVAPLPPQTVATLGHEDSAAIHDLHEAYYNSLKFCISEKDVSRHGANFSDLVNIAELSVRRVIEMAKQIPAFRSLPQVEQIHLLKGGSIELLILRSVMTFDKEKQHFLDPVDHEETKAMKLEQLEQAENGTGLFEDQLKFVQSLSMDLNADHTTLILLLVISLFSPDRENLEFKDLVSRVQERYTMLLKNYLESIYPGQISRVMLPKLLMKLTDIRNLNEEHTQVLLKVNPEGIQPLMKEVLDLSS